MEINYDEVFGTEEETTAPEETARAAEAPEEDESPSTEEGEQGLPDAPESAPEEAPEGSGEQQPLVEEPENGSHIGQPQERTAEQEVEELLSGAGLIDPYTDKPITNLEELRAYRERYDEERRRDFQESHNMTEEQYDQFVNSLPEVRAAREAQQQAVAQQVQAKLNKDLQEISKYDPTIKELSDLAGREEYADLCGMVERGYSLSDAWKLRHLEDISRRGTEAARQAALNSVTGKDHLRETTQRGSGMASVPPEVAAEYRAFMPDASDAEIQAHYNKYAKGRD